MSHARERVDYPIETVVKHSSNHSQKSRAQPLPTQRNNQPTDRCNTLPTNDRPATHHPSDYRRHHDSRSSDQQQQSVTRKTNRYSAEHDNTQRIKPDEQQQSRGRDYTQSQTTIDDNKSARPKSSSDSGQRASSSQVTDRQNPAEYRSKPRRNKTYENVNEIKHCDESTAKPDSSAGSSWLPRAQRQQQNSFQGDLSAHTDNPQKTWEPRAQRHDPESQKYPSQRDLSTDTRNLSKSQQNLSTDTRSLSMSPDPRSLPKSQQNLSAGPRSLSKSQQNLRTDPRSLSKSPDPRSLSKSPDPRSLSKSPDPRSLSKYPHNLAYPSNTNHSTTHSTAELLLSNPANGNDLKDTQPDVRKYQRNSAYKPPQQQNRQSHNLGNVPAGSTQSLNTSSLGHTNPALSRSAVSLNPAAHSTINLAGQADLGLSRSRLSLASQSISRNPSMVSLIASNPSLYRTVSAFTLYETGVAEPSSYLPVTIAGCILCCPIGVIGILFSIMARDALAVKDYPTAVRWGSIALWTGVAFIIGGVVLIITLSLVLGLYFS